MDSEDEREMEKQDTVYSMSYPVILVHILIDVFGEAFLVWRCASTRTKNENVYGMLESRARIRNAMRQLR